MAVTVLWVIPSSAPDESGGVISLPWRATKTFSPVHSEMNPCGLSMIASSLAKVEALKAGYDEAIMLSPQGYVSECTGENIFLVKHGRIVTPPVSAGALEGITQDSVRRIAEDLGIPYEVGNILRSDLYTADEAFLSGTAAEVVPVRSVDDREIGEPGPITRRIQETYFAAVKGQDDRYKDWLTYVND